MRWPSRLLTCQLCNEPRTTEGRPNPHPRALSLELPSNPAFLPEEEDQASPGELPEQAWELRKAGDPRGTKLTLPRSPAQPSPSKQCDPSC